MVEWSIAAFRAVEPVRSIVVACPPGHVHELGGHDLGVVEGGETRAQSVANALAAVGTELVAIHDAARPLVTPGLIEECWSRRSWPTQRRLALSPPPRSPTRSSAQWQTRRPPDRARPNDCRLMHTRVVLKATVVVEETLDRGWLWAAQTPQVFRTGALREALAAVRAA